MPSAPGVSHTYVKSPLCLRRKELTETSLNPFYVIALKLLSEEGCSLILREWAIHSQMLLLPHFLSHLLSFHSGFSGLCLWLWSTEPHEIFLFPVLKKSKCFWFWAFWCNLFGTQEINEKLSFTQNEYINLNAYLIYFCSVCFSPLNIYVALLLKLISFI